MESELRRKFMRNQLDRFQLMHEFITAVDGRKLAPKEIEDLCDIGTVRKWRDLFTPGMIGCSLSHYNVYRTIIDQKIPYALILEDDIKLSAHIPDILTKVEQYLESGSLSKDEPILLYYQSKHPVRFTSIEQIVINKEFSINYPINIWEPITTGAYVITYQCAQRLANLVYPIRYPADSWGVFYREKAIQGLRCVLPVPVQSGQFKSDIGYELNNPLNNFIKKLEARNIFPIKQLLRLRRKKRALRQNRYTIEEAELNWVT